MYNMKELWNQVKNTQNNYKDNGATLYFHNKEEFSQFVQLMNEVLKNVKDDFFIDRLLIMGSVVKPLTSKDGKSFNRWEILYRPLGKNNEESFLTTDENGRLINMIDIPMTDAIGTSEKMLRLIESGELKVTEYERDYIQGSHDEVGYSKFEEDRGFVM